MDKKYIERPKNADCEKQERKQKQKDRRSVGINIPKKYEEFIKKSIKESDLSTPQFIIKITNDYVTDKFNGEIAAIQRIVEKLKQEIE